MSASAESRRKSLARLFVALSVFAGRTRTVMEELAEDVENDDDMFEKVSEVVATAISENKSLADELSSTSSTGQMDELRKMLAKVQQAHLDKLSQLHIDLVAILATVESSKRMKAAEYKQVRAAASDLVKSFV